MDYNYVHKTYNIDAKFAILDASYLTSENTAELYDFKVSFIARMSEKGYLKKAKQNLL